MIDGRGIWKRVGFVVFGKKVRVGVIYVVE